MFRFMAWRRRLMVATMPLHLLLPVALVAMLTGCDRPKPPAGPTSSPASSAGNLRWICHTDDRNLEGIVGACIIGNGVVYAASEAGAIHAVEASTGRKLWSKKVGDGFEAGPLLLGDRLIIGDLGGTLHAIAVGDGGKVWEVSLGSQLHGSAATDGRHVVVGTDDGRLVALDGITGSKVWENQGSERINSAPVIVDGIVYVGDCGSMLRGVRMADGTETFSTNIGNVIPGSPVVLADRIIVGRDGGRVLAVSRDGQKQLWAYGDIEESAMVFATPAVADGIVVVSARDRQVHALNVATGKRLWVFKTHGEVDAAPVISDGKVYVGGKDKKLYALDLKTGAKLWEFQAARSIMATAVMTEDAVITGDAGGAIYCVGK